MFTLRKSKTQEPPWPSLFRGEILIVDGIGSCAVESHVDGTTYLVTDRNGAYHHVMPTPIFVWNKVQTMDGGTCENGSGGGPG